MSVIQHVTSMQLLGAKEAFSGFWDLGLFWDLQPLYDYNHLRYIQVGLNFRIHPCLKYDICPHSIMLIEKTSKSVEEKLSVGSGLFAKQARPQDWALEQC